MSAIGAPELLFLLLAGVTCGIVPFWQIFKKAGYPGVLALLMLVPLVNLILLYFLAFSHWPALKERP
jgi:hypothetical protein